MVVFVCTSTVVAGGFIGTPASNLDKGQFSVGFEYSYSSLDPDPSSMSRQSDEFFNGSLLPNLSTADRLNLDIRDFDVSRYYGVISYGMTEFWDVDLKLGIAEIEGSSRTDDGWTSHDFDSDFAIGWGSRVTLFEKGNVAWGASVQMNWLDTDWNTGSTTTVGPVSAVTTHNISFESYDILLAAGPTIDMGGWRLYGGPFYYYFSGDIDYAKTELTMLAGDTISRRQASKGDFTAGGMGGFLGIQLDLSKGTTLNCEFSAMNDGWAIGAAIMHRF